MLLFLIKASIVLLVLFLFYKWVLEQESFFATNRIYLLGSLLLCFLLPFISLPSVSKHQGLVTTTYEQLTPTEVRISPESTAIAPEAEVLPLSLPALVSSEVQATSTPETTLYNPPPTYSWADWLSWLYYFGFGVFLLHLLTQIGSLVWKIIRSTDSIADLDHTIINLAGEQEPCSFFRYIFINPEKYEYDTYEEILSHERIHVRQLHSIDLLLAEAMTIVFWFNPLAWRFRQEIEKNIEYQTDELWLRGQLAHKERYQMNLLKIASQHHPLTVTTNYNQSLIKQRILKMNAKKSNPHSMWKYAFAAPLLFVVLLLLNTPNSFGAQNDLTQNWEDGNTPESVAATTERAANEAQKVTWKLHVPSVRTPSSEAAQPALVNECDELEVAVRANDPQRVRELLEQLSDDCLVDQNGMAREDLHQLKKLLALGAELRIDPDGNLIEIQTDMSDWEKLSDANPFYPTDPEPDTAEEEDCRTLTEAILARDKDKVADLLKTTDPNCSHADHQLENKHTYYSRRSPLVTAAQIGAIDIAEMLLENGARVEFHARGECTPLMKAAEYGQLEMVRFLQGKGASVHTNMDGYGTALARAAKGGSIPTMQYLVEQGVNVNASGAGVGTPLVFAARKGQLEAISYLLDQGANPNIRVDGVGTALSNAARSAEYDAMELLIKAGADLNAAGAGVGTPLMAAVRSRDNKALQQLLRAGANVDTRSDGVGTALSIAAANGDLASMKALIAAGANTEAAGAGVGTPLIAAVRNGESTSIQYLLDQGANIDGRSDGVGTALSIAARNSDLAAINQLIEAGANPNLSGAGVGTPLMLAVRNQAPEVLELLLAKGADVDSQVPGVGTALSEAARNTDLASIKTLLAAGANPDLAGAGVPTPLMMAVRNKDQNTVELLLAQKANIDAEAPGVGTALSMAVRDDNLGMIKYLLAQQANPDAAAGGVGTPLIIAIQNGNYEIAKLLLENGADPNQVSYTAGHRSALDVARGTNQQQIRELLESHGAQ